MRVNLNKRKPRIPLTEERKKALAVQRAESKETKLIEKLADVKEGVGWASDQVLARYFDVSRQRIWAWSKEGKLPKPIKCGEATTRWKNSEVKAAEIKNFLGGLYVP
jgi:hypothetical protein